MKILNNANKPTQNSIWTINKIVKLAQTARKEGTLPLSSIVLNGILLANASKIDSSFNGFASIEHLKLDQYIQNPDKAKTIQNSIVKTLDALKMPNAKEDAIFYDLFKTFWVHKSQPKAQNILPINKKRTYKTIKKNENKQDKAPEIIVKKNRKII